MTAPRDPGFDRLRRRGGPENGAPPAPAASAHVPDTEGKRSLFSTAEPKPSIGSLTVACSRCGESTVVPLQQALRLVVPSVHLPFLRPAPWSYLRCPACHRLAWVDVTVHL